MLLNEFLKEHRKNEEQEKTNLRAKVWDDGTHWNGERAGSANPKSECPA
jgi:hypothetical protein